MWHLKIVIAEREEMKCSLSSSVKKNYEAHAYCHSDLNGHVFNCKAKQERDLNAELLIRSYQSIFNRIYRYMVGFKVTVPMKSTYGTKLYFQINSSIHYKICGAMEYLQKLEQNYNPLQL